MVLNAVVAFNIASIFDSAPKLANENIVNGITLFEIAKSIECFQIGFNNNKYFLVKRIGKKIIEANIRRI